MLNEICCEHLYTFHPSSYLEEFLKEDKISKEEFLQKSNMSPNDFENFINCKIDVTPELAEKLCKVTGVSINIWLNLQNSFNKDMKEIMERRRKTLDSFSSSNIIDVANYIINRYKERIEENELVDINPVIDQIKLQKLLYFTQRDCISLLKKPAFNEVLEGWKHGPVSPLVYDAYSNGKLKAETKDISAGLKYIIDNVIEGYGSLDSWKLSELSHNEISWINSREGLEAQDNGRVPLKLEDIKMDADKIKPFDYKLGVYYNDKEFFEKYQ
ncbi:DUF4065 domain-containing protein [bacterium]|nr:DUF4065 domain-containing protein [bacterium]